MEGINSFEKGLHRSNSPQMQPESSYVDALNWIRNDSGRLTNEELENITKTLDDAASYTYLGSCPVQDSFIIFFQQLGNDGNKYSEVGLFQNGVYERIFNDFFTPVYKLNFTNEIDSVARINNKGERVVYFVEENSVPRRFNIDEYISDKTKYNDIDDWNLQLNIKIPHAELSIETNGGSVLSGTYSVIFRYRSDINNKTAFGIPSRMIYITDETGLTSSVDGCPPGTQTTKSIKIQPINIDTNYPYIEPVIITYVGIANVLTIKSLGLYVNDGTPIYFRDETQYKDSVSLEEILENPIYYSSAKCIEQKDNILILSNLSQKKYDKDFQRIADKIQVTWYYDTTYTVDGVFNEDTISSSSSNLKKNFSTEKYESGIAVPTYPSNNAEYNAVGYTIIDPNAIFQPDAHVSWGQGNSQNATVDFNSSSKFHFKDGVEKKGFARGEIYSFSITPIYKDGSIGFAYHIPAKPYTNIGDKNTTDVYISEERYPNYLLDDPDFPYSLINDSTGRIRHHKMPDYDSSGNMKCKNVEEGILRVRFDNIDFGLQKNLIQGYIIGYQPRIDDATTRVINNGWVKPYMANGNNYLNSFFNGSCQNQFANGADMVFNPFDGGLMYYSPEIDLEKEINSTYKIQFYGWAKEKLTDQNKAFTFGNYGVGNFDDDTGMRNYTVGAFFDHYSTEGTVGNLYTLKNAIKVPAIGEQFKTVLGKYRLEFSKTYYHLELNDDVKLFLTLDWPTYFNPPQYIHINRPDAEDKRQLLLQHFKNQYLALVRIINDITFQYGKLENAQYVPSEIIFDINQTSIENVEGDTFTSKYYHHNMDGYRNNFTGSGFDGNQDTVQFQYIAGVWYESKNNYGFRHYDAINNETPYYPKVRILNSFSSTEKGIINYEWWKRGFGYNKQYSAINNFKLQFPRPLFFDEVTDYSNRSIYSKQSFENELVDQYRYFPSLQYHDIPKHRGTITDTFVFNNNFFHHTEYGLWLSYFNPNTIQSTTQGDVVLGNAGIFRIPSKLVLDIKGGYMGTLDKSGTNTPFGRVFLDHKQGKVFLFAGEAPVEISDLGLFSFFRGFVNTNDKYTMGYDWANKRLLINNITQEKAISYYPKTETWTSLHNFSPNAYFTINGSSYAWRNNENSFYNMDNPNGIRKNSYITLVENTIPDAFKRFDRMEINTMSGGNAGVNSPGFVEPTSYIFNDKSFSTIHCWTDRQNSKELDLEYSSDYESNFLNGYDVNKIPINYYRSSFHLELPLDAVVNPNINIFDDNNLDLNADFRPHMKGKFLYTKLSYNEDKPLVLNHIKTFFKPSVA